MTDSEELQKSAAPQQAGVRPSVRPAGPAVQLQGIDIFPETPLPAFDQGPIKAYATSPQDRAAGQFFALVCERHLVPRLRESKTYSDIINSSLVPLAASGVVYWPPARQQRYVFLYKAALGRRLLEQGDKNLAMGMRHEEVMSAIVRPMIEVLSDMHDKDFFHGAIRPSNMFDPSNTGKMERVVLGDCLVTPPSYGQSVLFETIERGMVPPIARGKGRSVDDIYAFGVTLAVLLRTSDPMQGLSDHDILRQKIEMGSYSAITGKDRFKGSILELLRGLLHDDPTQRWTIEEIKAWLDGRRLSPKQTTKHKKASRHLDFNGEKYSIAPLLALDLESSPTEAQRIVDSQDLLQWLERSLEDKEIEERTVSAINSAAERGRGPGFEDRLVCFLSTALDPLSPIRFKGIKAQAEGVGLVLAEAMIQKKDIKHYAEMLTNGIPLAWVSAQKNSSVDVGTMVTRFDACRTAMRQTKIGFGIERCVYLLCQDLHCLSDKLQGYYVTSAEEIIKAFEDLCKNGQAPNLFIDRHSAAFISVRDPKSIDAYLYDLAQPEEYKKILANVRILASIQKRWNMPMFPHIAAALMKNIPKLYERFHDRELREKIDKSVRKYVAEGDLHKVAAVLDNIDVINKDISDFWRSANEYKHLGREMADLKAKLEYKEQFGQSTGKDFSAVVAGIISAFIITVISLMFLAGNKLF